MTVTSTVVGILISIPIGLGAARNLAPRPVYYFCRGVLALSRSFQEVILAIFFVKLFGFGPFAGFVTLSVATVGFYGKLLRSEEHTSELQSLMRISYAVFCLKNKTRTTVTNTASKSIRHVIKTTNQNTQP